MTVQRSRYMTLETIAPLSEDPHRQAAGRGRLTLPADHAGERDTIAALSPRIGTRSTRTGIKTVLKQFKWSD